MNKFLLACLNEGYVWLSLNNHSKQTCQWEIEIAVRDQWGKINLHSFSLTGWRTLEWWSGEIRHWVRNDYKKGIGDTDPTWLPGYTEYTGNWRDWYDMLDMVMNRMRS